MNLFVKWWMDRCIKCNPFTMYQIEAHKGFGFDWPRVFKSPLVCAPRGTLAAWSCAATTPWGTTRGSCWLWRSSRQTSTHPWRTSPRRSTSSAFYAVTTLSSTGACATAPVSGKPLSLCVCCENCLCHCCMRHQNAMLMQDSDEPHRSLPSTSHICTLHQIFKWRWFIHQLYC